MTKRKGIAFKRWCTVKMLGDVPDTILPNGWIGVYHCSGAIVYFHCETRVVTWSRPYTIPRGTSLKTHTIPLMSIPCLHQTRAMSGTEDKRRMTSSVGIIEPPVKIMRMDVEKKCNLPSIVNDNHQSEIIETISTGVEDNPLTSVKTKDKLHDTPAKTKDKLHDVPVETKEKLHDTPVKTKDKLHDKPVQNRNHYSAKVEPEKEILCVNQMNLCTEMDTVCKGIDSSKEIGIADKTTANFGRNVDIPTEVKPLMEADAGMEMLLNAFGSDEKVGSDKISPVSLHKYMGKIFDFDMQSPENLKAPLLSCASLKEIAQVEDEVKKRKKKIITDGKSRFQILNEYCQREMGMVPVMNKVERISQLAFTVEILIDKLKFGIARGSTLKQAKDNAATCTLNIFDCTILNEEEPSSHLAIFDKMASDDKLVIPTIEESFTMNVKYPYDVLVHFLERNFGPGFKESQIEFSKEHINSGSEKYTMKYKEYEVTGECNSSHLSKQFASQKFISKLYPQLKNWGSVIRLMEAYTDLVATREKERKKFKETTVIDLERKRERTKKIRYSLLCEGLPL